MSDDKPRTGKWAHTEFNVIEDLPGGAIFIYNDQRCFKGLTKRKCFTLNDHEEVVIPAGERVEVPAKKEHDHGR